MDLPENSILLTFDDGLKDHFQNVYPILKKMKSKGYFCSINAHNGKNGFRCT